MSSAVAPTKTEEEKGMAGQAVLQLRPADLVLSRDHIGASWNGPLSFDRGFFARMLDRKWSVDKLRCDLDVEGKGEVIYRLNADGRQFHMIAVCTLYPAEDKIDRSYGVNWDVCAAFCQGEWTPAREAHLLREIPKQQFGRFDAETLTFTRGNRSDRLFEHVVSALAEGRQPDPAQLASVGYIFRTTAFAANGFAGMMPFAALEPDGPLSPPFYVQMAAGFLLRECVFDMADRMARLRNPTAAALHPDYKRFLGIGNSAGRGLIPFVHAHPRLIHSWVEVREKAFAATRTQAAPPTCDAVRDLGQLMDRAVRYFSGDERDGNGIFADCKLLAAECAILLELIETYRETGMVLGIVRDSLWPALLDHADTALHLETAELLRTLLLELYPDIVALFRPEHGIDEVAVVEPAMSLETLDGLIQRNWSWAFTAEMAPDDHQRFWYFCDEAPAEPRRGRRGIHPAYQPETAMDTPLLLKRLTEAIAMRGGMTSVAQLLVQRPDLRGIVTRVQSLAHYPYGTVRENTLQSAYPPFPTERLLLAFYGMAKLDPRLPRSTKGALLQGAPLAEDLAKGGRGDWPFPMLPSVLESSASTPALRLLERSDAPPSQVRRTHALSIDPEAENALHMRVSPLELQRATRVFLQARQQSLGVALEGGKMVELVETLTGNGLAELLRIEACLPPNPPELILRENAIDLSGSSLFAGALSAVDLVVAGAASAGFAAILLKNAVSVELLSTLPLMVAGHGLEAILTRSSTTHPGDTWTAKSYPGPDGPSYGVIEATGLSWPQLVRCVSAGLSLSALGDTPPVSSSQPQNDTAVLLAMTPAAAATLPAVLAAPGKGFSAKNLTRFRQQQLRKGLLLEKAAFEKLLSLGLPLWLPAALEPDVDPM